METRMQHSIYRTALALLLIAFAAPAIAQQPQVINVPLSRPGDPIYLEIGIQSARIEVIGEDREDEFNQRAADALHAYDARDAQRCALWRARFA